MSPISASARARLVTLQIGTCSSPPEADFASAPANSGEWRSVVTSASTAKAAAVRRIAPTLCGSVIWSRTSTRPFAGNSRDADGGERPSLEQQPLMDGLARRAGGDLLEAHDPRLEAARGDVGAEPLCRSRRGVEADEFAPRRLERSGDAVKAVDVRHLRFPQFDRPLHARRGRRRSGGLPSLRRFCGMRRFARTVRRWARAAVAIAGHRLERIMGLTSTSSTVRLLPRPRIGAT